jgi:hypothetical protein
MSHKFVTTISNTSSDEDFSQTELDQSVDILHEFIFEEDEFSSCRI